MRDPFPIVSLSVQRQVQCAQFTASMPKRLGESMQLFTSLGNKTDKRQMHVCIPSPWYER